MFQFHFGARIQTLTTNYASEYYCHIGAVNKSSGFQAGGCKFKSHLGN